MSVSLRKEFLPIYDVLFANIWCEIDGVEVPFKLYEAGLSRVTLIGESDEIVYFSKNTVAKIIFKKQEFDIMLTHRNTSEHENSKYYNYDFQAYFEEVSHFKKWLVFIKSIFGLYLKRSQK